MTVRVNADKAPHGFAEVSWDDASFPAWWWDTIERVDGCWLLRDGRKGMNPREFVVTRLLKCEWRDVLACIPTCANVGCSNPAHLCVTLRKEP